ncbi:MAG: TonB-dependent receptor [Gemmatimonadetes bacterium]|nr:TonB-dependent receptor [Gemmatimonadota bacterium]
MLRCACLCGLAVTLLAFARPTHAQTGKITGLVTDQQTGTPLAGVQVYVEGTGRGALTQENGRYFIINIPPGLYTVTAQLIGFATVRRENVQVAIDVTRAVDFALPSQAVAVQEVVVEAQRVPLIETQATGSGTALVAEQIASLPVTDLAGVLRLQSGFLPVGDENSDIISFNDSHRGISPIRIRGGRYGETLTQIDGIPVNNVLFGGPSFDLTNFAIQQLDLVKGGFEAQYGNALSGIINIATKEGTEELHGALGYQTSGFAGALGSAPDDVRNFDQYEGYVSGPVPGTGAKLRYLLSGRQSTGADRVLEFDDKIFTPTERTPDELGRTPYFTDLIPGWQSVGFSTKRDLYGKLTYYLTPAAKLNVGGVYYEAQRKPFNRAFSVVDQDFLAVCSQRYPDQVDWCNRIFRQGVDPTRMEDLLEGSFLRVLPYTVYNAVDRRRSMLWGRWDHTLGNTAYTVTAGRLDQDRLSCNWLAGVCLGDDIRNYTTVGAGFIVPRQTRRAPRAPHVPPATGTENFFGSDTMETTVLRADLQSQVTDHHNLRAGVFYQRHDFALHEARNGGRPFDDDEILTYDYTAKPWDFAMYLQDRIEYDFLTVNLGFRLDHFDVPGFYFTDPLDPTNGTTAFEVCEGLAASLGQTTPFEWKAPGGQTFRGISACSLAVDELGNDFLMDSARAVAFRDDFQEAPGRTEISPRIGLSFPVTESVRMFANYGRFSQNPLYHNLLQRTGIGRVASDTVISPVRVTVRRGGTTIQTDTILPGDGVEGTPLGPDLRPLCQGLGTCRNLALYPLVGNPGLESERTTSYEIGLLAELFENYGLSVVAFSKDQTGLTGSRRGGVLPDGAPINDPGETYGSTSPAYYVLLNTDYQTVRGIELGLKRGLANHWGFDMSYSFAQAWTNAAPPDLEVQKLYEGDPPSFREIRSEIDVPHVVTATLRFAGGDAPLALPLGGLLRNAKATLTGRYQSGFAYTPQFVRRVSSNVIGDADRGERNSGTAPAIYWIDLYLEKVLRLANLRYVGFLRVNNLFDFKTCAIVYPTSGRCDAGTVSWERGAVSGFQNGSPGATFFVGGASAFSSFLDRPEMFHDRRGITLGIKVSF